MKNRIILHFILTFGLIISLLYFVGNYYIKSLSIENNKLDQPLSAIENLIPIKVDDHYFDTKSVQDSSFNFGTAIINSRDSYKLILGVNGDCDSCIVVLRNIYSSLLDTSQWEIEPLIILKNTENINILDSNIYQAINFGTNIFWDRTNSLSHQLDISAGDIAILLVDKENKLLYHKSTLRENLDSIKQILSSSFLEQVSQH